MSYELKKDSSGKFRFNLKAGNGEIILSSQAYASKSSALDGISSVRRNGAEAKNYESLLSADNQPYFVLKAANGEVIGRSEMYSSPAARDKGIASVRQNSASETIKDLT